MIRVLKGFEGVVLDQDREIGSLGKRELGSMVGEGLELMLVYWSKTRCHDSQH